MLIVLEHLLGRINLPGMWWIISERPAKPLHFLCGGFFALPYLPFHWQKMLASRQF